MINDINVLKKNICEQYNQLKSIIDKEYFIDINENIHFIKAESNYPSGTYVFIQNMMYSIEYIGDRGDIVERENYVSEFDITYKILSDMISLMAFKFCFANKVFKKDSRRILFKKELEWLKILNRKYFQIRKKEIKEILRENPFDDKLLG